MRFADLFAGIGGFHLALADRGGECVFACEIDENAAGCYEANFKLKPAGDIRKIDADDVPEHDVLCAGFPCQPFSRGKFGEHDEGFKDERGNLFFEIVRIAKVRRPRLMILENVPRITTIDDGMALKTILGELEGLDYRVRYEIMDAGDFGLPQQRHRAIFIAINKNSTEKFEKPAKLPYKYLRDVIDFDADMPCVPESRQQMLDPLPEVKFVNKPVRIGTVNERAFQGYRVYSINGHAITQLATGGGVGRGTGLYLVDGKVRRLSILEAKRVMGFPDSHIVSPGTEGYRQLGNAVPPQMIGAAFDAIRK